MKIKILLAIFAITFGVVESHGFLDTQTKTYSEIQVEVNPIDVFNTVRNQYFQDNYLRNNIALENGEEGTFIRLNFFNRRVKIIPYP